ncbi:MAG TPA: hypothetical protein VI583_13685, partial [Cyclobacteriaceae bacterium]|nr:hypothetical protein [Cyclobacteriaceae bacterium]
LMLRKILSDENSFVLVELLRDVHPRVKIAAINTARITKLQATWPFLVELLGTITYSHHAFAALVAMGEEVLTYLEKAFHRSGQTADVMLKIARIYERIGGGTAIDLLWDKIDDPNKELLSLILNSLRNNKYKVPAERVGKIKNLLELTLGYTLWNLAAVEELSDVPANSHIRQALNDEIKDNFDRVYLLLGLMYDPQSISLVRKNIESGTTEGITFALELLDIFVDKEVRRKLFPILEDVPVLEKMNLLQDDFPREHFNEIQVLKQILNRDYNQINTWTKACALYTLYQHPNLEITDSMIAHLFNPDPLMRETSAWLIHGIDLETYNRVSPRIRREIRKDLNDVLAETTFKSEITNSLSLRFEKILFLKSTELFKNIPGYLIAEIVETMDFRMIRQGQQLFERLDRFPGDLFIVTGGKISVDGPDNYHTELSRGDAMGEILLKGTPASLVSGVVGAPGGILAIGSGRLFDLMARHDLVTKTFIEASYNIVSQSNVITP